MRVQTVCYAFLLSALMVFGGCKFFKADSGLQSEESESYPSEDVKWIGYFVGFASIQEPLKPKEGAYGGLNAGDWQSDYKNFVAAVRESKCGSRQVPPELESFYADAMRRLKYSPLSDIMGSFRSFKRNECVDYANRVVKILNGIKSKRGASVAELQALFVLDKFSDAFYMDKVKELGKAEDFSSPIDIFSNKTTPSLDFNNEVAAIISQKMTWDELGFTTENSGLYAYYMGKFIYSNKDSILFQISPLGSLYAVGDSWMDLTEGRDASGKNISRVNAGLRLGLNVAIATADAFGVKAAAVGGYSRAASACRRIANKAELLRPKITNGTITKLEVEEYQKVVTQEMETLKGGSALNDVTELVIKTGVSPERVTASLDKIAQGVPLTLEESLEIAVAGINEGKANLVFNLQERIDVIASSKRFYATRGHVFATEKPLHMSAFKDWVQGKAGFRDKLVVFQGDAAQLFKKHVVTGPTTAIKRFRYGELQTKTMGDLVIDQATVMGDNTLVITKAHIATSAEDLGKFVRNPNQAVTTYAWLVSDAIVAAFPAIVAAEITLLPQGDEKPAGAEAPRIAGDDNVVKNHKP